MNPTTRPKLKLGAKQSRVNRRAFLRGAGTVAIGLPFLEGLPERSAWAQNDNPIFSFFIVSAHGVVHDRFWPEMGALTQEGLAASSNATAALANHAANLTLLQGVNYPMRSPTNCGHAQGLCMALTARASQGGGRDAQSTGISADVYIADALGGGEALALYAGNKRNGYIVERLSFNGGGAGQVRPADDNPYGLYQSLTGLVGNDSSASTGTTGSSLADELVLTRTSVNDLIRDELEALLANPALSTEDRARLQQHFDSIRDAEVTMGEIGEACSMAGINTSALEAMQTGFRFDTNGMIEDVVELHMQLVAVAFGCGLHRTVSLQWGDGTDQTRYQVPSNQSLNWPFHHVSHRAPSDGSSGTNPTAEAAHAEVDALRMQTLAAGLDHFAARGLQDRSFVYWSSHVSDGPTHSFQNLPIIIWGNAGGYIKTGGQHLSVEAGMNNMMNTLISAATGTTVEDFGEGNAGQIAELIT
ncbi:MAG TPA: DUF1552 domain-containing protein [Polyangiaceae bacterium]